MPDPTRRTLSATQAPALWNVSPYVTRWMLWHHFASNLAIDTPADARMDWGKRMQPLVLAKAAEELALEVRPNESNRYIARTTPRVGCTRDAEIICPDRGPGALETKCVFDYRRWMQDWQGGEAPPRHHEIQLQTQMFVGDGASSYSWGVIAAWVGAELHYFERKPIPELWDKLAAESETFFESIRAGAEPDPFGAEVELPWLAELFPTVTGKVFDLRNASGEEVEQAIKHAKLYRYAADARSSYNANYDAEKAWLRAFAKDHDEVLLPGGIAIRVKRIEKHMKAVPAVVRIEHRLNVHVPEDMMTFHESQPLAEAV